MKPKSMTLNPMSMIMTKNSPPKIVLMPFFFKVKLVLISPDILQMRKEVAEEVSKKIDVTETPSLKEHLRELDVIYMTRVQKERFADLQEYEKVKGSYRLVAEDLDKTKKNSIVMHPLPRVDEVDPSV